MFWKKKAAEVEDESGLLSAIWILACNDQIPFMLYESLNLRLNLSTSFDLKTLIGKHGELFRRKCPPLRLREWKDDMLAGKRVPLVIAGIADETERKAKIDSLTVDDVFRSQFRPSSDAPRSDIAIITWGLEHIERLRKARIEANDQRWKKTKELWIPLLSLVLVLISILVSAALQYRAMVEAKSTKELEVLFKPRQESYSKYMTLVSGGLDLARKNLDASDRKAADAELTAFCTRLDGAYYEIEPFLGPEARKELWERHNIFQVILFESLLKDRSWEEFQSRRQGELNEFKDFFRQELTKALIQ